MISVHAGDCLELLKTLADNSVDAVVTDPPYELGFMGKGWDATGIANNPALWTEVIRVLKPGGHVAAFGGTRTYHRMACAIEDVGFEIRDQLAWAYGSGFPKSHDVSKGLDKAAGAEREIVGTARAGIGRNNRHGGEIVGGECDEAEKQVSITVPATGAARQWEGWGTALKPAWEPICLARKPLSEKTVAANVLRWGTGAINVDGCRIGTGEDKIGGGCAGKGKLFDGGISQRAVTDYSVGRWPANLCHDGSPEVLAGFPETASGIKCGGQYARETGVHEGGQRHDGVSCFGDTGSAARFFYCAKASKADRAGSKHPTVKPVKLMQWLCRLITPPGGMILDPFAGTGTTGEAAWREGFSAILIERDAASVADIQRRMAYMLEPARVRKQSIIAAQDKTQSAGPLFSGLA